MSTTTKVPLVNTGYTLIGTGPMVVQVRDADAAEFFIDPTTAPADGNVSGIMITRGNSLDSRTADKVWGISRNQAGVAIVVK